MEITLDQGKLKVCCVCIGLCVQFPNIDVGIDEGEGGLCRVLRRRGFPLALWLPLQGKMRNVPWTGLAGRRQ